MNKLLPREWKSYLQSDSFIPTYQLWFVAIAAPPIGVLLIGWAVSERQKVPQTIALALAFLTVSVGSAALLRWRSQSRKADMATPVIHEQEICRSRPHFYVRCSCGWDGPNRSSYRDAANDARAHGGAVPKTITICDDPDSGEVCKVKASEYELEASESDDATSQSMRGGADTWD